MSARRASIAAIVVARAALDAVDRAVVGRDRRRRVAAAGERDGAEIPRQHRTDLIPHEGRVAEPRQQHHRRDIAARTVSVVAILEHAVLDGDEAGAGMGIRGDRREEADTGRRREQRGDGRGEKGLPGREHAAKVAPPAAGASRASTKCPRFR